MWQQIRAAVVMFVLLSLVTGVVYPLVVTGLAQVLFPRQAQGSLIDQEGVLHGSDLIGQQFDQPHYFWGRPSATGPMPYNAASSSGSNLGPTNPALIDGVKARIAQLQAVDPDNTRPVPVDLVTASASGLDPHISPAAADYQIARVARERQLPVDRVRDIVARHAEPRTFGVLGEPRVNVLRLNLDLDALKKALRSRHCGRSRSPLAFEPNL